MKKHLNLIRFIQLPGIARTTTTSLICFVTSAFIFSCNDDEPAEEPYLTIPDSQFEARLIEEGIDSDTTINQKLLKTDAEKVTHLHLDFEANKIIKDLTGIEGFVNLTYLTVDKQDIETIDLSHNTKLDTLWLVGTYLTTIDLSANLNLLSVNLPSNELETVEGLSNAGDLRRLDLSWNYLEDIVIQNQSLENLFLNNNFLESIDVTESENLRTANLVSNQISTVDFSNNIQLEVLIISDNKLQEIQLDPLENLTYFYSSSNELLSLDVSQNPMLVDLRVDRNPDLTCIKTQPGQEIPTVILGDHQELSSSCP